MKLNIGCGKDVRPGYVNVDQFIGPGVDVVIDLDKKDVKLPFHSNSVDEILASHCLEHMYYWHCLMVEFARVLRPGGVLVVKVPRGWDPSAYHVRYFEKYTLDVFIREFKEENETSNEYLARPFKLISRRATGIKYAWLINRYLGTKFHNPWLEWELERVRP